MELGWLLLGDAVLRLIRRLLGLAGATDSTEPDFPTVVYSTAPDPTEWMTEREKRYHLGNNHGR